MSCSGQCAGIRRASRRRGAPTARDVPGPAGGRLGCGQRRQARARLFIDLGAGACQSTNALHATDRVVAGVHPRHPHRRDRFDRAADLPANLIDFDALESSAVEEETWRWLGNYASWKAAMYTLLYP
jgi:hypothetical protein